MQEVPVVRVREVQAAVRASRDAACTLMLSRKRSGRACTRQSLGRARGSLYHCVKEIM